MVAARIPAMAKPAKSGGSKLVDIKINTFSAELFVSRSVGYSVRPIQPITTAAIREITHQMIAILLDIFSSFSLRIAIKRSST